MIDRIITCAWVAVILILFASPSAAVSQELHALGQLHASGSVTSETSRKMVSSLRALIADTEALGTDRANAGALRGAARPSTGMLNVDDHARVQVYVHVVDTSEATMDVLRRHHLDIEIINHDFAIVQGWIPADALEGLAGESVSVRIRPPSYGTTNVGPITSEGTAIHRCDQAEASGFTGLGVKVGVISGGVSGLAVAQTAGELPNVQVLSNDPTDDEGTAMLEIVHDCAPDASLSFASAGPTGTLTTLAFIQAVNALRDAGANIVVDDIFFGDDPNFEDGITAQNDRVVGDSVVRVSAAGNLGLGHYQGMFTPGGSDGPRGTLHDFGGGDSLLRFRVPAGSQAEILLQWADPFGAATDDYNLYVRRTDGSLLASSHLLQNGNDDPLEAVGVSCSAPRGAFCLEDIQIDLFRGSPRLLELTCLGCEFLEFNNPSDAVSGHQAVPEVLAVAAASAATPGAIEPYSAAGPSTILFPTPEVRSKPDLTGTDCVSTSRPGFNPFCGTSAAAPHVAGVAALLMQAMGPSASPAAVRQVLKGTAIDLGPPGPDASFGFGRADALTAVQAVTVPPPPSIVLAAAVLPASRAVQIGTTATVFATIIASGSGTATGCTIAPATSIPGTFSFQMTDKTTNVPVGSAGTPATIPVGSSQTFVIAVTPSAPVDAQTVQFVFACDNAGPVAVIPGVNTLLLSASTSLGPDVVALAGTVTNDGIASIPGTSGTGFFVVASVNVGTSSQITVSADTGSTTLPVSLTLCQTDARTSACLAPPTQTVSTAVSAGDTSSFAVFARGNGSVPFDPGANRIFVRFRAGGAIVGETSVAVRTQS